MLANVALALALGSPAPAPVEVGLPAPEIEVKSWLNTKATTLAKERGRVIVLEFWATW
jgi:hypothetical protein